MKINVLTAIFKRNFVSYFSTPTGYLFICAFVLLCSTAAFWTPNFFNNNLANLDQLSWGFEILGVKLGFPFIMLVFIPSITMGIWADERRQGTDELLLTIPASDADVVLGKYFAASATFTVSLIFSLFCNLMVLRWLGNPDVGLFLCTYLGYWFIGLTMLSIGMVASFLTSNLTVAYILGAAFNCPLVFASVSETLFGSLWGGELKQLSLSERFNDFGRGVISLSSVVYFILIAVVMLYVCLALIGRRHWATGRGGEASLGLHYCSRAVSLIAIAIGVTAIFGRFDVRFDATSERINELAPQTKQYLASLKFEHPPALIEAFISPEVPESYIAARLNLISALKEIQSSCGGKVQVVVHDTAPLSEESALAEKKYDIRPFNATVRDRGTVVRKSLFMHVAVSCGLQRIPPLFVDRGTPIEYELVRSLGTVATQRRKKIGVLQTDAQVMGRANVMDSSGAPKWPMISELEKQYDVVSVNPTQPIAEKFDVLLAVQPSAIGADEMANFIACVKGGQPTAIFEDPLPVFVPGAPGTSMPRKAPGGMQAMMMGMRATPKGDISPLFQMLGVNYAGERVIWQDYNPYPKNTQFPVEFVIVDQGEFAAEEKAEKTDAKAGEEQDASNGRLAFNPSNPISSGVQQVMLLYPGSISKLNAASTEFSPLVITSRRSGFATINNLLDMTPFGPRGIKPNPTRSMTSRDYVLAAEIRGKIAGETNASPEEKKNEKTPDDAKSDKSKTAEKPKETEFHAVFVGDIDMLTEDFFRIRELGRDNPDMDINFDFDNVTFMLNVVDQLSGDTRFIDIRKRRPKYRTLTRIERETAPYRREAAQANEQFEAEMNKNIENLKKALQDKLDELRARKDISDSQKVTELSLTTEYESKKLEQTTEKLRRESEQKRNEVETRRDLKIRSVQDWYKMWAVFLPPLPPLAVGVAVFLRRRSQERLGVSRSRMR